jgi:tol-pal system protein YbgF
MQIERALLLLALCFILPAKAGLLDDDEARQQIKLLEGRVVKLEDALKDALKQQTKSLLDLQGQIDALTTEIRNVRGGNEETTHGLQDAEKREKDFYVDLDSRLRRLESAEAAAKAAVAKAAVTPAPVDPADPAIEDRAIEAAYTQYRAGSSADAIKALQDFMSKFPDSAHAPNATYWLGNAQFAMKDYKGALETFQNFTKKYAGSAKTADVMYGAANCLLEMDKTVAARKTLMQLVVKYPDSDAAAKAKKLLAATK